MQFNFWTILLIAAGSQSLFLIIYLLINPPTNRKARIILVLMLGVAFLIAFNNLIISSYLYRHRPGLVGFSTGMILLFGPIHLLYVQSITDPKFNFKYIHLGHLVPYAVAFILLNGPHRSMENTEIINLTDALMDGRATLEWNLIIWLIIYSLHLLIYILLSYQKLLSESKNTTGNYHISFERRTSYLKRIAMIFAALAFAILFMSGYVVATGTYAIQASFAFTLIIAILIYFVAFNSIKNGDLLTPHFTTKYASLTVNDDIKKQLLTKLEVLLNVERSFRNPDLKIELVANQIGTNSKLLSQVINETYQKGFSELLNHYRVAEFKQRINDPRYSHYSIMGIANDSGYRNKSTFNVAFKKETGLTPTEYISSLKVKMIND